ncbi:MAG: ferrochelatase [Piscinibacter sp.]|uniref:ferrochelatase n=1 Tax=Piscinibacter sp. TaxID=1903157 RepID=UPI0025892B0D|nr:ferrochelatase [Piscinibacter sp.]MCW5664253.1 ferrochelatase [Piscinibacter sp.]
MTFAPEPPYRHGSAGRTGVLLVNLGTPDAPTPAALRRYLAQFLSDPRVVEIPRWAWWPILHGIILRVRPARSAKKYASIWTEAGSPLAVWTAKQATLLRGFLGERGHPVLVRHAMRYGNPSIASQLDALKAEGATRVLVLPLYPQYAGSTTASALDAVTDWMHQVRHLPELRAVNRYHDDPLYIEALARRVEAHWQREGRGERLVLSFHGVPKRTLLLGDPYHCECLVTARLLRERLGLDPAQMLVTFQSRFGKAEWLQPYTEPTLIELARSGVQRVDVMCPGFTSDCLETLEEIDQEVREAFLGAGGQAYHYIPCLNDDPAWIAALAAIAIRHMQGWPVEPPAAGLLAAQRERALAAGAAD